jgi:hypothetical protein
MVNQRVLIALCRLFPIPNNSKVGSLTRRNVEYGRVDVLVPDGGKRRKFIWGNNLLHSAASEEEEILVTELLYQPTPLLILISSIEGLAPKICISFLFHSLLCIQIPSQVLLCKRTLCSKHNRTKTSQPRSEESRKTNGKIRGFSFSYAKQRDRKG